MINLYRGKINLTHPKVTRHAEWHANNPENLYERQLEKFIYWYTDLNRITYPVTSCIGLRTVLGFHPGTSRLIAQYFKGEEYVDCLCTLIIGDLSTDFLLEVMPDARMLPSEEVMAFDAGGGHWEFRLKGDDEFFESVNGDKKIEWYERDNVAKVNKKSFWSKHSGYRWIDNETKEMILDRSRMGVPHKDIMIFSPKGFFQSAAFLIDGQHEHAGTFQILR